MIKGVARDWPIYGFIAVYFGVVSFVVHHFGGGMSLSFGIYNSTFMTILCLLAGAFFVYRIFFVMIRLRPDRLTRTILTDFKTFLEPRRVVPGVLLILAFPLFFVPFGAFKSAIPIMNGFSWDPAFAEWDRWLHGGTDPWLLLQPLLGTPRLTTVVNFFYHAWFFVFYALVFWQAFSLRERALRLRFLLSFLLVWSVVGSLFAVLLSSAGPAFYGQVTGLEDPFAELMGYLAAANEVSPVWALNLQDMLWTSYQQDAPGFGHGISAMPSVHVALAVQLAIMGWHSSKSLGLLLTGFALMIQIGSVHLGYHYAIDGYLGALLAGGIWYAVGPLSRRLAETVEISEPRLEGFGELAPVLGAHSD